MTNPPNSTYENLMRHVLVNGQHKHDRTETGTISSFAHQIRFNLKDGFPLVTTKAVNMKAIIVELLWFLRGDTNTRWLKEHGVYIWEEWADENNDLGPVYGAQWRRWPTYVANESEGGAPGEPITYSRGEDIDQIAQLVNDLRTNADSRRLIVSAWNVGQLKEMALPPCHAFFQFYVINNTLSCQLYQRSADMFLGVPFNIASYALLTHMLAQQCGMEVGEFIWTGGDCHVYSNHIEQVNLQLSREPFPMPTLNIKRVPASIFDYTPDDFELLDYQSHPAIRAKVAV